MEDSQAEDNQVLVQVEDGDVLVEGDEDQILLEPEKDPVPREQFLFIGQEFTNVDTCRSAIKDMAVALHFQLRVVKSDRSRFIAKCNTEGCPWRVHVAKCHGVPTFTRLVKSLGVMRMMSHGGGGSGTTGRVPRSHWPGAVAKGVTESKADCAFNNDGETTSKVESAVEIDDDGFLIDVIRESKADCAFNDDGETTSKVESAVEINDDGE
ncbi:hypothetical protein TRIUR3_12233 [Triticum urartu]|uniref:Transposase MuDR plant domain-containing protein n=1 Tax=Triticum urartu TaxID=4572 RepID=M7ZCL3_TRIUA|nr:hypothetical protein TRIUR3_12233 [Triticum urartu]